MEIVLELMLMIFMIYNEFGIGSRHSGVLFLVDMKTRTIYMTTTGDAMDMYSDYRIEQIWMLSIRSLLIKIIMMELQSL